MALYNAHKRATLDRLTLKYQLRMREVLRVDLSHQVRDIRDALDSGLPWYLPQIHRIEPKVEDVFAAHRKNVLHVAVSDGIQEISPDQKLASWAAFPIEMPIEETLGVALGKRRDEIVIRIGQKGIKKEPFTVRKLVDLQVKAYLANLRKTYVELASDWLAGEGSTEDVIRALRDTLVKTDYEAVRILRTETTNYFNESRYAYFSGYTAADYVQLYAVTDGRISKICEDRHGFVVPMEKAGLRKYMPAFHPHCRTIQRALISALRSHLVLIEKGLAMNEASFAPLPRGWKGAAA